MRTPAQLTPPRRDAAAAAAVPRRAVARAQFFGLPGLALSRGLARTACAAAKGAITVRHVQVGRPRDRPEVSFGVFVLVAVGVRGWDCGGGRFGCGFRFLCGGWGDGRGAAFHGAVARRRAGFGVSGGFVDGSKSVRAEVRPSHAWVWVGTEACAQRGRRAPSQGLVQRAGVGAGPPAGGASGEEASPSPPPLPAADGRATRRGVCACARAGAHAHARGTGGPDAFYLPPNVLGRPQTARPALAVVRARATARRRRARGGAAPLPQLLARSQP